MRCMLFSLEALAAGFSSRSASSLRMLVMIWRLLFTRWWISWSITDRSSRARWSSEVLSFTRASSRAVSSRWRSSCRRDTEPKSAIMPMTPTREEET